MLAGMPLKNTKSGRFLNGTPASLICITKARSDFLYDFVLYLPGLLRLVENAKSGWCLCAKEEQKMIVTFEPDSARLVFLTFYVLQSDAKGSPE